jgi:4-amino-4-deoxy-L-arabinose transferase-like glycosyltransferase
MLKNEVAQFGTMTPKRILFHPMQGALGYKAWRLFVGLGIGLVFFLLLGYRIHLTPDIHLDEMLYYRVSFNLATTGEFTWEQNPVLVHPPMQFLLNSAFLRLVGMADTFQPFDGLYTARLFNVTVAAVTAVIFFRLLEDLTTFNTALLGSFLLILDPFVIRINRRNYLETLAEFWIVAGLYLYWRNRDNMTLPRTIMIGLVFGVGLLTKELVMFGYGVLVVFVFVAGRWQDIKRVILIGMVAFGTWCLFPFWAWSVGQWDVFIWNKTYNFQRLIGKVQISGWNRPGVSFVGALKVNLVQYASSYILIVLGGLALVYLALVWRDENGRFAVAWAGTYYGFFAYSIAGGALNDQFFYFLLVPVMLVHGVALGRLFRILTGQPFKLTNSMDIPNVLFLKPHPRIPLFVAHIERWLLVPAEWAVYGENRLRAAPKWLRTAVLLGLAVMLTAVFAFNISRWVKLFAIENDNSLQQLSLYIQENIPPGTKINSMFTDKELTIKLMLPDYELVTIRNPAVIEEEDVAYAILSTKNLWGRYGEMTPDYFDWVKEHGTLVFSVYGNTFWDVELYKLELGNHEAVSD